MKTPEKLIWLFGESIDVNEALILITIAAILIIIGAFGA